jgi:hypothetical protein
MESDWIADEDPRVKQNKDFFMSKQNKVLNISPRFYASSGLILSDTRGMSSCQRLVKAIPVNVFLTGKSLAGKPSNTKKRPRTF